MKALIRSLLILLVSFLGWSEVIAGPRSYGKSGTATNTNTKITLPFHPVMVCVANDSATVNLYVDYRDGVAVAADNSTNQLIKFGETYCWTFLSNVDPNKLFEVGLITAASTADYRINASRAN